MITNWQGRGSGRTVSKHSELGRPEASSQVQSTAQIFWLAECVCRALMELSKMTRLQ